MIDKQDQDYHGPVEGVVVQPHDDAEPLQLLFGSDLFLQDYCKTQFATIEVHVAVVALFRTLHPHFADLHIIDEGEFWETNDRTRLQELWNGFHKALASLVEENSAARVKVRLPSGRIIDAMT